MKKTHLNAKKKLKVFFSKKDKKIIHIKISIKMCSLNKNKINNLVLRLEFLSTVIANSQRDCEV